MQEQFRILWGWKSQVIIEMEEHLTSSEKRILLQIAREALENRVQGKTPAVINLDSLTGKLSEKGASFVTLTIDGNLRGCIGGLEATCSLAEDVQQHAIAAAFNDFRFPPVRSDELDDITIEISYLTDPKPLIYNDPSELLGKLCPGVDGEVVRDGIRRATFLPQVWEKIPDPRIFLNLLCQKMGMPSDFWQKKKIEVLTYQVEKFSE